MPPKAQNQSQLSSTRPRPLGGAVSPGVPSPDLAPGIEEIYEESQQVFLAPGHPQDGQVIFYKVSRLRPPRPRPRAPTPILNTHVPGRSLWTVA